MLTKFIRVHYIKQKDAPIIKGVGAFAKGLPLSQGGDTDHSRRISIGLLYRVYRFRQATKNPTGVCVYMCVCVFVYACMCVCL